MSDVGRSVFAIREQVFRLNGRWQLRPEVVAEFQLWCDAVNAITTDLHPDHWPSRVVDLLDELGSRSEYDA